nr:MAG: capsid protein [Cressdnaviricota sp.]
MSYVKRKKMSSRRAASTRPGKRMLARGYASFQASKASSSIGRSPATRGSSVRGYEVKGVDMPAINAGADSIIKNISTTATLDLLNGIQEGASFYNRVGRRVHMKSVHVTGQIFPSGVATTGAQEFLRVLLVYDRQPNGTFPSIGDILLDYGNDGTSFTTSISKMNLNNVERFAILRDKRLWIPSNQQAASTDQNMYLGGGTDAKEINWFVPLKNLETHFKSTTNPAAIGDVATGALYLVTLGNIASGAAGYNLQYNSRLRFCDV